jgi:translocation and assembly module TamB
VKGLFSGIVKGQWLPGQSVDITGKAGVTQGEVAWRRESGTVATRLEKAEASFAWREKTLNGKLSLALSDYGWLQGDFQLPVEARIPPAIQPAGSLRVALQGKVEEKGLLPAIFPGVVQKTRGRMELNGRVSGSWQNPEFRGSLKLSQAGALIPPLGIQLKEIDANIQLVDEKILVESLSAESGPGRIEGKGTVWLEGWRLKQYEGKLQGERFQAIYLPEIRALINPRLEFKGTAEKVQVRGEIRVPQLLIHGKPTENVVLPSADVVIVDKAPRRKFPLELDLDVRILLGDRVLVNAYGLDARLSGDLEVKIGKAEETQARGEIKVEKGHYGVYGVRLEISRGRFLFAGGPLTQPSLDILALRKVKEVEAGVIVTGDAQKPLIQLYSRPAMADSDILSYIILGRPFSGSDPKDINLLLTAAGVLLSQAESVSLQDRVKSLVGLDTLDIESGSGELSRSMVTVGKYLTPDLYVSLGYAVFSKTQDITMRATIIRQWEIESTWGGQGAVDLYYKIEFY